MNKKEVNKIIGKLLIELYDSFPKRIHLCPEELDKTADIEKQILIRELIEWLSEEGFIRYSSKDLSGCFEGVVLTMKGFAILNSTPKSLTEKRKFIDTFRTLFEKGSISAMDEAIKKLFDHILEIL